MTALAEPERATRLTFGFDPETDSLPAELWTLTQLRELNLACPERLEVLPPEIAQLRLLETLTFDCGNNASMNITLPEEIGSLKNLTVLRLYGAMDPGEVGDPSVSPTRFKKLPEAIRSLTRLKTLDLGRNGLPYVPPEIASLEELETLDLRFNQIREIPEFIGGLRRLRSLSLQSNGGMKLPASLAQIKGLRVAAGNNHLDLKTQNSLRKNFPNITFDFENEYDDCAANEPVGGDPEWLKNSCEAR
jgi:Leucine-rich repeat (LRR) protein